MTRKEAQKVAAEMEAVGFSTSFRKYGESYSVDATDTATGVSITVDTVEQWAERKATAEFDAKYSE